MSERPPRLRPPRGGTGRRDGRASGRRSPRADVHAVPGRRPVAEALRAGRRLHEVVIESRRGLGDLASAAHRAGVAVREAERDELNDLAGGVVHQGVVALAPPFVYRTLADLPETDLVVLLDGVSDPQNLGSIARSAELAGAGGLVLPKRRSVSVTPAAEKASSGALSWLPVAVVPNLVRALEDLAARGLWSVGLDGSGEASLWSCHLLDGPTAIVVGAEGRGLSRLVTERVDARVAIPVRGRLDSLNAAVATSLALFEVVRRRAPIQAPSDRPDG